METMNDTKQVFAVDYEDSTVSNTENTANFKQKMQ